MFRRIKKHLSPSPGHARSVHPAPRDGVSFFSFLDGSVLFHRQNQLLWALNASHTHIWCLLYENLSAAEIARQLADTYAEPLENTRNDVERVLKELDDIGLLQNGRPLPDARRKPDLPELEKGAKLAALPEGTRTFYCGLDDMIVKISVDHPALYRETARIFEHQQVKQPTDYAFSIEVMPAAASGHFDIYVDGFRAWESFPENEVIPYLFGLVFVRRTEQLNHHLLFHSAVLAHNGNAVVLPGVSGSGKSTLSHYLTRRQWTYLSDEIAVFPHGSASPQPLPMAMKLKTGSFEVARQDQPEMEHFPVHLRMDDRHVRFVNPPAAAIPEPGEAFTTKAIVFPTYEENGDTRLQALDRFEAIQRLFHNRIHTRAIETADVETLITLVERTRCYTLTHSDSKAAQTLLSGLVETEPRLQPGP